MAEPLAHAHTLTARLAYAGDLVIDEVSRVPPSAMRWKPADDVWSVMEILCHVAEFVPYWTGQAMQVAQRPGEQWGRTHTDTARIDAVAQADSRSPDELLDAIRAAVSRSAAAIHKMTDAELATEAVSRNSRWGRQPASFIIDHLVIEHLEKHAGQVRRNRTQFEAADRP